MDKLIKHFSLDDWDYSTPAPYLDDTVYVSPPTSLASINAPGFDRYGWAICNLAEAACIPDGRLISHIYFCPGGAPGAYWYYRHQLPNPPAYTHGDNQYHLGFNPGIVTCRRVVAATPTNLAEHYFDPPLERQVWHKFRLTFWQVQIDPTVFTLRNRLERWVAGAWVELFSVDDGVNQWKDAATNKVGFHILHGGVATPTAIDDTEVWKKA